MDTKPAPRKRVRLNPPASHAVDQTSGSVPVPAVGPSMHGDASGVASIADQLCDRAAESVLHNGQLKQPKLNIEYVSVDIPTPASEKLRRAGKHLQERLQRNIRRFGIVRPILVRRRNRKVIAGHSILEAAKALGITEVPVIYIDHLTDDEVRTLRISLHKIEELSSWDDEALKLELDYLVDVDPELLVFTGFDTTEIDVRLVGPEAKTDAADDVPKLEGPIASRRGDVWVIKGGTRLICGDALDPASYAALLGTTTPIVRLVLSDVPYNVPIARHVSGRSGVREFAMASGEMTTAEFTHFLKTAFGNAARVSMDGSLALYFIDWRHLEEMLGAGRAVYADLKNLIVWAKTNAGMGSLWRSQHELIFAWKLGSAPHVNNFRHSHRLSSGSAGPPRRNPLTLRRY